ncbi:cysteine desulfurase family protein [Candidatus Methylacidithermus pantelleriae]|uniref:Cysteine desulfurase n=1 Tax=Candidatus Methylacidithermus pantelleriae TaxID=2744239 RepID=A0A8J2BSK5_9BACT|nr:cysteine desulfurase family protein [Candidatus Methylacidithermus pantelleriae]CAF0704470.1 Cysteine desulfurase [Candidatus Methylacidithermus pantelleriae]
MGYIYFDHQSGTPVLPEVREAMLSFLSSPGGTASLHRYGVRARQALEQAREQVARLLHAKDPGEILFCSGGTEAANLVIQGVTRAWKKNRPGHVISSRVEHPSLLRPIQWLEANGWRISWLDVDRQGFIHPSRLEEALQEDTALVALHWGHYELGTIQKVRELAQVCQRVGVPLFLDGSHAVGWLPIDVETLGVSFLSATPYRFYGPKGVGILYRRRDAPLAPLLYGGIQEKGLRPGTENLPGIVGAGVACQRASEELSLRMDHVAKLQALLWSRLNEIIPTILWHGPPPGPDRIPYQLHWSVPGAEGEAQALLCDLRGVAVATGPACLISSERKNQTLAILGLPSEVVRSNLMVTLGKDNTEEEVEYFVRIYQGVIQKIQEMSP